MLLPSERELELFDIIKNGTHEEVAKADKELKDIWAKEIEEEKKNPPPWGDLML